MGHKNEMNGFMINGKKEEEQKANWSIPTASKILNITPALGPANCKR